MRRFYLLTILIFAVSLYMNRAYAQIYDNSFRSQVEVVPYNSVYLINNSSQKGTVKYMALGDSLTAGVGGNRLGQTYPYNINPSYDYTGRTPRITSYQANTTLSIKVRQLSNINNVIDQATAAGANQVNNITFDISDKTKAQEEARQKAVAEAKSKADAAARIAGFKLGRIINYNENFGDFPRPLPMVANALDSAKGAAETSIEPGSSDIRITVTLSYELR